jgi:hypothetical protein
MTDGSESSGNLPIEVAGGSRCPYRDSVFENSRQDGAIHLMPQAVILADRLSDVFRQASADNR